MNPSSFLSFTSRFVSVKSGPTGAMDHQRAHLDLGTFEPLSHSRSRLKPCLKQADGRQTRQPPVFDLFHKELQELKDKGLNTVEVTSMAGPSVS